MRIALASLLFAHGFAHLVGFVGAWRLSAQVPYKTTIFDGRFDVGDEGIRAVGLLWLSVALAFAVAGVAAVAGPGWFLPYALVVSSSSLVMCLAGWPDARIGAAVNAALLGVLFIGAKTGW